MKPHLLSFFYAIHICYTYILHHIELESYNRRVRGAVARVETQAVRFEIETQANWPIARPHGFFSKRAPARDWSIRLRFEFRLISVSSRAPRCVEGGTREGRGRARRTHRTASRSRASLRNGASRTASSFAQLTDGRS